MNYADNIAWLAQEAGLEPAYPIDHPMAKFIRAIAERAARNARERVFVELTAEEVIDVANAELSPKSFARGAAWANAKLKEKNHA